MTRSRWAAIPLAFIVLVVPPRPADAQWQPRNCTTVGQNLFVRDVMQDIYFWYQFLPDPNPVRFRSPYDYLEAVRYRPLDETFSYITTRAENDAFYSDSQFIGFGFGSESRLSSEGTTVTVHVTQVYPDSPAFEAGLSRGDEILTAGGRTMTDWWRAGQLGSAFGPSEIGYQTTLVYRRGDSSPVQVSMVKRLVTIPTVSLTRVYEQDGRRVGYLFFRNFVRPSVEALNQAFAEFRQAGVVDLIVDVRYNGGGLVSVAEHLASLVGGTGTNGQIFAEFFHNDRNTALNEIMRFEPKEHALSLERVIVIATPASASASELFINSLRPFMRVVVVGDRTYGKPVGQYGINFCDKVLAPVAFTLRNADQQGDFFGGIPADCRAPDDLGHQLGDPAEGSLSEAIFVVRNGTCSAPPAAATMGPARRAESSRIRPSGFRQLLGAW